MKRTTFSLLFYIRRNKLNKSGEAPVFMLITINGERADASVKRSIVPRLWNTTKGKAVENSKLGKDLNLYLDAISANLLRLQRDMELDGVVVSAHAILDRYLYLCKNHPERHTIIEVFKEHNEKCRALLGIDYAQGTIIRYETSLRLTVDFLRNTYQKEDLYWDCTTVSIYRRLRILLKNSSQMLPQYGD